MIGQTDKKWTKKYINIQTDTQTNRAQQTVRIRYRQAD